ncbi:uncharacterized protein LOC135367191 isoform X2 [Ornithodoros turicata]|uniref:uncharacterized protein LOC135367191 isoform X2 n=1 Tax=Ornithodoros turicata TaxID=34597 RepID=UPI003139B749
MKANIRHKKIAIVACGLPAGILFSVAVWSLYGLTNKNTGTVGSRPIVREREWTDEDSSESTTTEVITEKSKSTYRRRNGTESDTSELSATEALADTPAESINNQTAVGNVTALPTKRKRRLHNNMLTVLTSPSVNQRNQPKSTKGLQAKSMSKHSTAHTLNDVTSAAVLAAVDNVTRTNKRSDLPASLEDGFTSQNAGIVSFPRAFHNPQTRIMVTHQGGHPKKG